MDCPKCSVGKLNELTVQADNAYRSEVLQGEGTVIQLNVDQCFVCNGVWFDAGELKKYLGENLSILDSPVVDRTLVHEANQQMGKCPRCRIEMVRQPAVQDRRVTVDRCEQCHGVWLDSGELDRLELKQIGKKKVFSLQLQDFLNKVFRRTED